ncbi:hypothetical protein METBIDRAFT_86769 [Metschnikowia bicuspidata var. bicuspidata NRRL YB-4993]|uniref:Vacuolar protein sorting-associated protein 27 n=1 Tax=Metschnikowia bicuspidata var. bicuspidata NRRL YB-4993 TaxID=869754 RepID=A0A1A0HDY0_9ASCO|nr:hypothetical protein METBIDRAFT_86769 [Metschnikowia bicuspidata var. bicuspidata NRRL YB-4993]OBA22113.1 hypothetical protein METBIDRAFT_86769 [Metschnikowia bicuspidata var. bicuspidata NRRL YB-4993]
MSWFAADPAADLDARIEEATSEAIPNGEMDMAAAMEITDLIRSKKVPPKQAMRCLKKRLAKVYGNPNTLAAVLKLADVCVKNGGAHFVAEINLKEFVDYLVEYIFKVHYDTKNYRVYSSEAKHALGTQILRLVQEWALYLQGQPQGSYVARAHAALASQGYEFPAVAAPLAANARNFVDSAAPPDWVDGRECMVCYTPFLVMTRKHHCRACGGVFCQAHSSRRMPLVALGILQPVRVCDDCFQIHSRAAGRADGAPGPAKRDSAAPAPADDDDEQLRRAIELSLQETGVQATFEAAQRPPSPPPGHVAPPPPADTDADDADLKAAMAASLAEYQQARGAGTRPADPGPLAEPGLDFYLGIMPFNTTAYQSTGSLHGGHQPARPRPDRQLSGIQASQPQPQHQHQQPQPQHQQPQPQPQRQSPPQPEQLLRPAEDLSPQEEDDINLFVQLMSGIKSDPAKQAGILYDQNLGELHGRVVRLKPKLNRALRSSIERHELFLEMNNKINSITRLYDQFLDHKLSQAYSKHSVSLPGAAYSQPLQNDASRYAPLFFENGNRPLEAHSPHAGSQLASPQTTGYLLPYQATAPQPLSYQHPEFPPQQTAPQDEQYQTIPPPGMSYQTAPPDASRQQLALHETAHQQPALHDRAHQQPASQDGPPLHIGPLRNTSQSTGPQATSKYPPIEESDGPREHASARFPLLHDLGLPELGLELAAGLKRLTTNESRKFRAEPEPLIEL